MRFLTFFMLFGAILFALDIKPTQSYQASGSVTDMVYDKGKLYVATAASRVDIFDTTTHQKLESNITLSSIKDFMGDTIDSKIYSIDLLDSKILLVSQGVQGFREICIYDGVMKKIIGSEQKMFISKALFVDDTKILFALLSNELFLYDIASQKILWQMALSHSKFSDFVLNETRNQAVVADESGDLKVVDVHNAKIIKTLEGENLDNVFRVDTKQNIIITAGQDRKCVVYDLAKPQQAYFMQSGFLIYAVGLSPSAKWGAYSSDEQSNAVVFDTQTKQPRYTLKENKMTLSKILFINEKELFVGSDSPIFNYYNLNGEEK
ncbi:MAG: hypothetical protein KU28_07495 [Sulfurovum sp. PC08-66]|jgi:WD40 repeat protein|nr:MAG: hypothetical protein KU28_07495 [Sulfurovum sp. PC08-66]